MRRWVALVAATALSAVPIGVARAEPPHLLLFSGTFGYRHAGIDAMVERIEHLAALSGSFSVERTEDQADLIGISERADGVIFLQTTGSPDLLAEDRNDFLRFIECGAPFIGIHAASDSGDWPEYTEMLGARFSAHGHFGSLRSYVQYGYESAGQDEHVPIDVDVPALTEVTINVEDQAHPATSPWHGEPNFKMSDELYQYQDDPRTVPGLNVLLSLDNESDYWPAAGSIPNPRVALGRYVHDWFGYKDQTPVAWTKPYGAGRVFYTNLGHNPTTWDRTDFQTHLVEGIRWALGQRAYAACLST